MSIWYLAWIPAALAVSWVVSDFYSNRCRCTERRLSSHGAMEFNATFFALQFIFAWIIFRERPDSWIFAAVGGSLAFFVIRRFWVNWIDKSST